MGAPVSEERKLYYSQLPLKALREEEKETSIKLLNFARKDGLAKSIKSRSSQKSQHVAEQIRNLEYILDELTKRRKDLDTIPFKIPHKYIVFTLRCCSQGSLFGSMGFDFSTLFLTCHESEWLEITSVALATTALAFAKLRDFTERRLHQREQQIAALQGCQIDQLAGVKAYHNFLCAFTDLTRYIEEKRNHKQPLQSISSSCFNSCSTIPSTSPPRSPTSEFLNTLGLTTGKKGTNSVRGQLAKKAIAQLQRVPSITLENFTNYEAQHVREVWIQQIEKMANVRYVRPALQKYPAAMEINRNQARSISVDNQPDVCVIDVEETPVDLSRLSMHALLQNFKDLIKNFNSEFSAEIYISHFGFEDASKGNENYLAQKKLVNSFISRIQELRQLIKQKQQKYESKPWLSFIAEATKLNLLAFCKHGSEVIFFGSTALANVTPCTNEFGVRDVGKIIGVGMGFLSSFFDIASSLANYRANQRKVKKARVLNSDFDDLDGIDGLIIFIDHFLVFVDRVKYIQARKNTYIEQLRALAEEEDDATLSRSEAIAKAMQSELKPFARQAKSCLDTCLDALLLLNDRFLENIVTKNSFTTKQMWSSALKEIYLQCTTDIKSKPDQPVFMESTLQTKSFNMQQDAQLFDAEEESESDMITIQSETKSKSSPLLRPFQGLSSAVFASVDDENGSDSDDSDTETSPVEEIFDDEFDNFQLDEVNPPEPDKKKWGCTIL